MDGPDQGKRGDCGVSRTFFADSIIRSRAWHAIGTKLPDGLQKSLRLGSFHQDLRKGCKFYVYKQGLRRIAGITHRGSGIAVRSIPCRDKFAAG